MRDVEIKFDLEKMKKLQTEENELYKHIDDDNHN